MRFVFFSKILGSAAHDIYQSLKVRSSYIEQLRNLDVIVSRFIPTLLHLLRLDQGPLKVFKLDLWAVDEFHIECTYIHTHPGLVPNAYSQTMRQSQPLVSPYWQLISITELF